MPGDGFGVRRANAWDVTNERIRVGRRGEDVVAAYLERQGWQVLARNWRCHLGEIDLVARDPAGVAVVCEVKARSGLGFGAPLEAITHAKLRRLRGLAVAWLGSQERSFPGVRVDAFGVLWHADGTATIHHARAVEP